MFKQNLKKIIFTLGIITLCFTGVSFVLAQTTEITVKTDDKKLIKTVPGLKQVEAFRVKQHNQCESNYVKYQKLVIDKDLNKIIDTTKRDLAYEATQNALPDNLQKIDNQYVGGLADSENFIKFYANMMCMKFFGIVYIYYGVLCLMLIIFIKEVFSK